MNKYIILGADGTGNDVISVKRRPIALVPCRQRSSRHPHRIRLTQTRSSV
jgi:hypothetical protein